MCWHQYMSTQSLYVTQSAKPDKPAARFNVCHSPLVHNLNSEHHLGTGQTLTFSLTLSHPVFLYVTLYM